MVGLGTLIDTVAVIIGGFLGLLTGHIFKQNQQEAVIKTCGVSVLFMAIASAMQGMLRIQHGELIAGRTLFIILTLAVGTIIGEGLDLEQKLINFGEWLKGRSGNQKDARFVEAFVTTSLSICIGAMAVIGAIQDGASHDISTLVVKSVLDFLLVLAMSASMGPGAIFSAITLFLFQGVLTIFATWIAPILTETALADLSLMGSILIFAIGINLIWGKMLRVANMLPALVLAVCTSYILPLFAGWF